MISKKNIADKVIVITGATSGIGRQLAIQLASSGANLVLVGRSQLRTQNMLSELNNINGVGDIVGEICDLSLQSDVYGLADRLRARYGKIDILVNNAGAMFKKDQWTKEGFERTWALNYNSVFLLTTLICDLMIHNSSGTIINTASASHRLGRIHWDDLQFEDHSSLRGWRTYTQSKLAVVLFTNYLAYVLKDTNITANAVDPGWVSTRFSNDHSLVTKVGWWISQPLQLSDVQGSKTLLWLSVSKEADKFSGCYFYKCKPIKPSEKALNMVDAARLWELSEQMMGVSHYWDKIRYKINEDITMEMNI